MSKAGPELKGWVDGGGGVSNHCKTPVGRPFCHAWEPFGSIPHRDGGLWFLLQIARRLL